ncbi:hypothetical protein GCM10007881_16060 [Mesorhizobium huakuii]|uniref:hypothetical protein n=1 Tax=Mesorhizobium huakuii TaxID=28104 RepID=UPI00235D6452|nr:hypothetical protein [Mesorhizobium huakuii]GLQ78090.1 hypothetical protein GCM10007881_16060 [Mesorhizobium huakuii]
MTNAMTRRAAFGAIASIPAVGAAVALPVGLVVAKATEPNISRVDLLYAYSEWLHFERLMLMRDIFPGQNHHECARSVPCNTHASWFHFPLRGDPRGTWETIPSPASRALAVMTTAGVDLTKGGRYAL